MHKAYQRRNANQAFRIRKYLHHKKWFRIRRRICRRRHARYAPKIQWVPQKTAHKIKMIIPKTLFNGEEFNEESLEELDVYTEPHYLQLKEGEEIQFVRFGYCRKDSQNQAIFTHK